MGSVALQVRPRGRRFVNIGCLRGMNHMIWIKGLKFNSLVLIDFEQNNEVNCNFLNLIHKPPEDQKTSVLTR